MRPLTSEDAVAWCEQRRIFRNPKGELWYGAPPARRLEGRVPATTAGLIYAARILTRLEAHGLYPSAQQTDQEFQGCMIWVIGHSSWSPSSRDLGAHIFARLGIRDEPVSLDAMPARVFEPGEITAAEATLLQPLLFQWDTYVVTESGNYTAYVGHDGIIRGIIARSPDMLDGVKRMFKEMNVREGVHPGTVNRKDPSTI